MMSNIARCFVAALCLCLISCKTSGPGSDDSASTKSASTSAGDGSRAVQLTHPMQDSDEPPITISIPDQSISTVVNQSVTISLPEFDDNGVAVAFEMEKLAFNGTVYLNAYELTYTPDVNYIGSDYLIIRAVAFGEAEGGGESRAAGIPDPNGNGYGHCFDKGNGHEQSNGVGHEIDWGCHVVAEASVSVHVDVVGSNTYGLNDTGMDHCYKRYSSDCPSPGFPGQDLEYGRDVEASDPSDGELGFSFTKLDEEGRPLPSDALSWSCVRDNVTGLVWENKATSGLHRSGDRFSWYNPRQSENNGFAGYQRTYQDPELDNTCFGFNPDDPDSYCNTEAFIRRVNASNYCGVNSWSLPTTEEMRSIVNYSHPRSSDKLDDKFFAELNGEDFHTGTMIPFRPYLTDSFRVAYAPGAGPTGKRNARGVVLVSRPAEATADSIAVAAPDSEQRCDSNISATTPTDRFTISANGGEVIDSETGLTWRRCLLGSEWDGAACVGESLRMDWSEGLVLIQSLGQGWRVPNIKELGSIAEKSCQFPTINKAVFPNVPSTTLVNNATLMTSTLNTVGGSFYIMDMNHFTQATLGSGGSYNPYYLLVRD